MSEWVVSLPERLDVFLSTGGGMLSRAKAQKAVDDSRVRVNDAVVTKSSHRLQEGDRVKLTGEEAIEETVILAADLALPILYEDGACIVINKPAGIAVHPGAGMAAGEKTILHGIAHLFADRSLSFSSPSVLVHRLDKETTGCLLIAKDPASHRKLQEQFETRTVKKQYLALVAGVPSPAAATIDAPIGRSSANRTKMSVTGSSVHREAQTSYRVLSASSRKDSALLLCDLHTGRTHQVRVHLSSVGHPVLGDGSYRNDLSERLADEFDIRSLCLHAWRLAFTSPDDQKVHEVEAPLPRGLEEAMGRMGIIRFQEQIPVYRITNNET